LLECGLDENRLVLQGMGIVPEECTGGNRDETRRRWGVGPEHLVVGHLANLSEEKGTIDLLRAADLAGQQGGRWKIVLAGASMPNFQRYWERNASDHVRVLGVLSDEAKRNFFAAIDVFALPSRVDSFGLVLLEAWANGVPVIGYRAGGIPWVIRDGEDGFLVRCGDLTGLATALLRLGQDRELRHRLGQAGQQRAGSELHWDRSLEIVKRVYERIGLTEPPAATGSCSPSSSRST
jgi:glycosyltransferase involved in cell wall biosynthesis